MSESTHSVSVHVASDAFIARAAIKAEDYRRDYARSIADPDAFWAEVARRLDWYREPTRIRDVSFDANDLHIRWFADGELNASVNCLDRHLATRGDKTALLWEADDPTVAPQRITYREMHARVCRLANALRNLGVGKGDRVAIYLPMIPEAAVAMLACARIGAVHTVVFGGLHGEARDHRRRRSSWRQDRSAESQCRRSTQAPWCGVGRNRAGRAQHRRRGCDADAARSLVRRDR